MGRKPSALRTYNRELIQGWIAVVEANYPGLLKEFDAVSMMRELSTNELRFLQLLVSGAYSAGYNKRRKVKEVA